MKRLAAVLLLLVSLALPARAQYQAYAIQWLDHASSALNGRLYLGVTNFVAGPGITFTLKDLDTITIAATGGGGGTNAVWANTATNWLGSNSMWLALSANPFHYLLANQTITLSGDALGSGATSIPVTVTNVTALQPAQGKFLALNATGIVWSNVPAGNPGAATNGVSTIFTNGTALSGIVSNLNLIGNGLSVTGEVVNGQANIGFTYPPINNFTSTPQTGMKVWLTAEKGVYQDAAGTIPATLTGDPVQGWYDQSPNVVNFTNKPAGPVSTPFYEAAGGPNGYPCVYFDSSGSPSVANLVSKAGLGLTAPIYVFAVLKGPQITLLDGQVNGANRLLLQCGSSWQIYSGSGLTSSVGSPPDWILATWYQSGSTTSFYRMNGRTLNTGSAGAPTVASFTLGADYNPNGGSPFWLAELQVYTNAVSFATVEAQLRSKYNLY